MKRISTHILDMVAGRPAIDVAVRLEKQIASGNWELMTSARTDHDGRCPQLLPEGKEFSAGIYRLTFETGSYYAMWQTATLYPLVEVIFQAKDDDVHFHIPVLLSPNGYTTYRGS